MNLIELIPTLNDTDDDLIIFIQDIEDFTSDILLDYSEEDYIEVKVKDDNKYYYLLEVFLAKEFVQDLLESIKNNPNDIEIAKRLYKYAINDA
jgi:hypothetical protein